MLQKKNTFPSQHQFSILSILLPTIFRIQQHENISVKQNPPQLTIYYKCRPIRFIFHNPHSDVIIVKHSNSGNITDLDDNHQCTVTHSYFLFLLTKKSYFFVLHCLMPKHSPFAQIQLISSEGAASHVSEVQTEE